MNLGLMKLFDKVIPDSLKPNMKELAFAAFYYKNFLKTGKDLFTYVDVETNTQCNRYCNICPNSLESGRGNNYMEEKVFSTLLEQLAKIHFSGRLSPVFYNEPTLDDRLVHLMDMAHTALPKAKLIIYTNGSKMTQDLLEDLVNAGVKGVIISQYEDNVGEDNVTEFLHNLPKELKPFVRYRVLTQQMPLSTRAGLVSVKHPAYKKSCYQGATGAVVDWQGNVIICCNDYFTTQRKGNIMVQDIDDIWNLPEYRALRQNLIHGKFDLDICKKCANIYKG